MAKRIGKKQEQRTFQARIDIKSDTPSYYVNFIAVSHSAYEISLTAAKFPAMLTEEQQELVKSGQQIPIEPILQLMMPPLVADALIKALLDQRAKQEQTLEKHVKDLEHQHSEPSDSIQ
jgi:hypothetical protein